MVTVQTFALKGPKDEEVQRRIINFIQDTLGMAGAAVMVYICPEQQQTSFEESVN